VDLCRSYHQDNILKVKDGKRTLDAIGRIQLDNEHPQRWQATNEVTGERLGLLLPLMKAGEVKFEPVTDFAQAAPVVDEIAKGQGLSATIFQRINDHGDMLRIASSVKGPGGTRAIGDYLPAAGDGGRSKAIREVLVGRIHVDRELLAKTNYLTAYQPLKDEGGKVVGMLETALLEDQIPKDVRNLAASAKLDHEELFILEGGSEKQGTALITSDTSLEGSDLWNEKDAAGRLYVQELCTQAIQLGGQATEYRFQKATQVGGIPTAMIARTAYVPELDWVVGFAQPETEFLATASPTRASMAWALWFLLGAGITGTGLAVRIWIRFSDDLAHTLNGFLNHIREDAKELSEAAAAFAEEAERALATQSTQTVRIAGETGMPPSADEISRKAARTIEEIRVALSHIDASGESIARTLEAADQVMFATNLLMVTAAMETTSPSTNGEPIARVTDQLRSRADECGRAARTAKAEIEQTRLDLEKGRKQVEQLISGLDMDRPQRSDRPHAEVAPTLKLQAETLLRLAEGIGQTVDVIKTDLGVAQT
jgi:hypothetical protein